LINIILFNWLNFDVPINHHASTAYREIAILLVLMFYLPYVPVNNWSWYILSTGLGNSCLLMFWKSTMSISDITQTNWGLVAYVWKTKMSKYAVIHNRW